ncbi:hypothetical protein [Bacillus sp. AFS040349]|uniref:hypothetical protein n=1 Tax=Bacillus sp. AFS040349 TaxID=2033502 RepID=UPI000BFE6CE7|nr:hypothetical protein [Bacillus sp. AFS040349]PGT89034.1 hypothetical protein COD11_04990 [Bacillus sp. AFS040349]
MKKRELIEAIVETLYPVKDYDLEGVCYSLGMKPLDSNIEPAPKKPYFRNCLNHLELSRGAIVETA